MDHLFSEPATSLRRAHVPSRPSRLGQTLREARQESRLGLEDVAELTGVRPAYLEALEAGRFADLPGEQGKTFVLRYAQAVGLEPARVLVLYAQERRSLAAADDPAERLRGLELPAEGVTLAVSPRVRRVLRLFASLLLVAAASWLALRAFDGALSPWPHQSQTQRVEPARASALPSATAATADTVATPSPALILFSLRTTPPGAEVSVDGYRFGQSPIIDAPVRAGNRTIKVERSGYGTFERTLELTQNRRLNVTLAPTSAGAATFSLSPLPVAPTETTPQAPATQQVVVSVTSEAWLEVYRGSARAGERLVYTTAQPGETYTFTAPVYVFSGNAGGVLVVQGDTPAQPLGAPGAVVGRAYRQP